MGQNVYQTKNYFIGSYHYVNCYSSEFVVPTSTAEVAQALAHYYKMSQVQTSHRQRMHCCRTAQPLIAAKLLTQNRAQPSNFCHKFFTCTHPSLQAGTPVTLRTSRPMFHSSATFPCPIPATAVASSRVVTEKGQQAAQAPVTVGLLQHKLNKVGAPRHHTLAAAHCVCCLFGAWLCWLFFVLCSVSAHNATTRCWLQVLAADETKNTMRVGAGMRYTEFLKEAQAAGMSVQVGRQPLLPADKGGDGIRANPKHKPEIGGWWHVGDVSAASGRHALWATKAAAKAGCSGCKPCHQTATGQPRRDTR